jgi:hypothetical protein
MVWPPAPRASLTSATASPAEVPFATAFPAQRGGAGEIACATEGSADRPSPLGLARQLTVGPQLEDAGVTAIELHNRTTQQEVA